METDRQPHGEKERFRDVKSIGEILPLVLKKYSAFEETSPSREFRSTQCTPSQLLEELLAAT